MSLINVLAAKLETAFGVTIDKTHENAYQRVFKVRGAIDVAAAASRGAITAVTHSGAYTAFTVDGVAYNAVPALNTITAAKA